MPFLLLCALAVRPASAEVGFTSLFNGKDLSGWAPVGTTDAFKIEKGAILSTGALSLLASDRNSV